MKCIFFLQGVHMQKPTTYQQLQPKDRIIIATMKQRGFSVRAIARTLERAPSAIAREVARNTSAGQNYGFRQAQLRRSPVAVTRGSTAS
jgi:IS30 family transposase